MCFFDLKKVNFMKNVPNIIDVQEDIKDRKQTIGQVVKKDDIPFKLSKELRESLKEGEQIIKDLKNGKRQGYNNVNDMLKAIIND